MLKIKNNLSRREVLSLAVVDPTDPTAKWELEKIGFWCQILFASWKRISQQNRLQAQNKEHSDLHSLLSSVEFRSYRWELLWDNRQELVLPCPSLEDPPSIHMASKFDRKMCWVLRRVQEMWRTVCPRHGHKYNKTLWVLTVPQYKSTCTTQSENFTQIGLSKAAMYRITGTVLDVHLHAVFTFLAET